jgi:succinate dehydrogenase / fumarate reductase iron-sulfur subunit
MTILDALFYVKEHLDPSLVFKHSCRMATCGCCGLMVNGVPRLACYVQAPPLASKAVTLEPLAHFPVIRDLAADLGAFFTHHGSLLAYLIRHDNREQENPTEEYRQSRHELERYLQFAHCIKCGLCYSACPTVATDELFAGPQALSQAYRYAADSRDEGAAKRLDLADSAHGVWRCHFAGSCSAVCPKGVDPALAIQLLRRTTLGGGRQTRP